MTIPNPTNASCKNNNQPSSSMQPSDWLCSHAHYIKPQGDVVDIASGYGRNARWLAEQGHWVEAVDINTDVLSSLNGIPNINTLHADLEAGEWPYVDRLFDAIVVCRYLHRPLFRHLISSLKPGGIIIYETFMQGQQLHGKPSNPGFLLDRHELLTVFMPKLTVLAYEQGELKVSPKAVLQRICARNDIKK